MKRMMQWTDKKKEKIAVGLAVFLCFVIHMLVSTQFTGWFSGDAYGYLSHAATITGRDWSGVLRNASSFYSWGYSLLLTIPMLFTSDIIVVYHVAMLFNVLLCCGILLLCYGIAKMLAPDVNKYLLLLCATAVSLYTTYIFQGTVLLSEMLLYFFVLLSVYLMLKYFKTHAIGWGIGAGLAVGYTYIVHNRSLAVVIAYVLVVLVWSISRKDWKSLIILLLPLALMLLLNQGVLHYLNLHEKQGQAYTKNTYASQSAGLKKRLHFYSLVAGLQCLLGELWYLIIGTFGVGLIGISSAIKSAVAAVKEKKKDAVAFWGFVLLLLAGSLGISLLACIPTDVLPADGRYDLFIYGRYWETVFAFFLLLGMIECCRGIEKKNCLAVISGSICLSVLVELMTRAYQNNAYNFWAIPAVLNSFFYPENRFTVLNSSVVGITFMIFLAVICFNYKKAGKIVCIGAWIAMCIFSGYSATYHVAKIYKDVPNVINMPFYESQFQSTCDYLSGNGIDDFAVCASDGYRAVAFQVKFMEAKVTGVTEDAANAIESGKIYVVDKMAWAEPVEGTVLYENENYYIMRKE